MRGKQINLRLEQEIVRALERLAEQESLDRATLMRQLLLEGIGSRRLDRAISDYLEGAISLGRAAEDAGIGHWDLMDEVRRRLIANPLDMQRVDEGVRSIDRLVARKGGFRTEIVWAGRRISTLGDVPPRPGGGLLVGINPAVVSVRAGHYYQGRLGRRLWKRLESAGLLVDALPGVEDEAFERSGHGLTDLVKRPTASPGEVTAEELRTGAAELRRKIEEWTPGLVIFVFKKAAQEAWQRKAVTAGPGPPLAGVPTFLLSGPYAPLLERGRNDKQLEQAIKRSIRFRRRLHSGRSSVTAGN